MRRRIRILRRKLRSFRSLDAADRRRVLAALALLPAVSLGIRGWGYARCRRWLGRRLRRSPWTVPVAAEGLELARAYSWAVDVAAGNVPVRARCLERSLALWWLLRRRGVGAEVELGVRKTDAGELEAHAWVEVAGRAVNDGDDVRERFAAFDGRVAAVR